jgi:N,N-dimethylformamidase beta subunit-like, C-terminal
MPPMHVLGWVSDERDVAVAGADVELVSGAGRFTTRSTATGAVLVDAPPATYRVAISAAGHGAKWTTATVGGEPVRFRLLADGLTGYVWPKWAPAGSAAEVRVHATAPYAVELWRYGWEKERVRSLGYDVHAPGAWRQVIPDGDVAASGAGWRDPVRVVAPERSGLYCVHVRAADGGFTTLPWIVAPERPREPVAVLASALTWNAYNAFGGRSNYISPEGLPAEPAVNLRQALKRYVDPAAEEWEAEEYAALSFDRPEPSNTVGEHERITDPVQGRDQCGLASAEWRLLGWLEREGIGHDLYADAQLELGEVDLSAYRVLVLAAHPEYWTRGMYDRVKRWVHEEGGRLVYLGGNGLNCEVELPDAATMIVRNGDGRVLNAHRDEWESRFGMRHEPEANLLGIGFTRAGLMTGAPYRVLDAASWVFEGTRLRNGDLLGVQCLHTRCPGGASGHEMDKRSPSSPANLQVVAKGTNPDGSGAEMAWYESPSGGLVFSAGSISFPCALPVDDAAAAVTRNVLRRFSA